MDRVKVCAAICRNSDKTLVFVRTKRGADRLVEQLRKEGVKADAIHGDLRQANRERTLKDFADGKLPGPGGHRRGRPGPRHRHGRRGRPLRSARGPQGLPAPLGPHRPGRRGRRWWSRWCSGTRSSRSSASRPASACKVPIVEIFSNDPRLADLAAWQPGKDLSTWTRPPSVPPPVTDRPPVRPPAGRADRGAHDVRHRLRTPMTVDAGIEGIERILVVTAHPDDVDFGAAGSVARLDRCRGRGRLLHRHRRRRRRLRPHRSAGPTWPPSAARSSWTRPRWSG